VFDGVWLVVAIGLAAIFVAIEGRMRAGRTRSHPATRSVRTTSPARSGRISFVNSPA